MSDARAEQPPPGWYAGPQGEQRWWDGMRWTEHTLPPPAGPGTTPLGSQGAGRPVGGQDGAASAGRGLATALLVGALVLGVVLLLALTVLDVVLLAR